MLCSLFLELKRRKVKEREKRKERKSRDEGKIESLGSSRRKEGISSSLNIDIQISFSEKLQATWEMRKQQGMALHFSRICPLPRPVYTLFERAPNKKGDSETRSAKKGEL